MSIRILLLGTLITFATVLSGCEKDGRDTETRDETGVTGASVTPEPSGVPTPLAEPPLQLKIATINLRSPLTTDVEDPVNAETFEQRLDIVIEELRAYNPDIVGFNEASWTRTTPSAAEKLSKALKMEFQYARANPWFPGQSQEQSDETVRLIGFEEGELILSKYPILRAERHALNPRTSETEGRAALHAVIRTPGTFGEVDVYITHLTAAEEHVRQQQASDFANWIRATRGPGPLIVLGDFASAPGGLLQQSIQDLGVIDVVSVLGAEVPTCCRLSILGEQPALETRTDYIYVHGWPPSEVEQFGYVPRKRSDGALLYASDHNGLVATFAAPEPVP